MHTASYDLATSCVSSIKYGKLNLLLIENLIIFSNENKFSFPYLIDETQEVAKGYDAVCTPDFFGYNKNLELQYRGRLRELKNFIPVKDGDSELLQAMRLIADNGKGPKDQTPSAGCSIKWKYD